MKHFLKGDLLLSRSLSHLVFGLSLSLMVFHTYGQSAKTAVKVDQITYDIEVVKDKNSNTIKLSDGSKFQISKTIYYFTAAALKEIVINEHGNNLVKQNKPAITASAKQTALTAIDNAFLELISILYNTEDKGQKIADVTLSKEVGIRGYPAIPDAKDSLKGNKWAKQLSNKITRLKVKDAKDKLDSAGKADLKLFQETLSEYKKNTLNRDTTLTITNAEVVFEDGAIKQIIVKGTVADGKTRIFSNRFSVGTTTRRNIQNFNGVYLYQESHLGPVNQHIRLSDVLSYSRVSGLRTNDFSPADIKIELVPEQTKELFKSPSSRLFSLNIFSDFVGFNENNPNGLVQLEFSKRLNLWTKRIDTWIPTGLGIGWFTYMTPRFEIAKIEENNRSIKLQSFTASNTDVTHYLSPLELYRFSYARISDEVNFMDLQGATVSIHLNAFAGIAVTQLRDTVSINSQDQIFNQNINSLMLGGVVKALFNPESKWSYELSMRTTYLNPLTDAPTFRSLEDGALRGPNEVLNTWEFLLTWNTGSDNKLFGRFRFNHEWDYWNNNFSEFQIGYSIFLKSSQVAKNK